MSGDVQILFIREHCYDFRWKKYSYIIYIHGFHSPQLFNNNKDHTDFLLRLYYHNILQFLTIYTISR